MTIFDLLVQSRIIQRSVQIHSRPLNPLSEGCNLFLLSTEEGSSFSHCCVFEFGLIEKGNPKKKKKQLLQMKRSVQKKLKSAGKAKLTNRLYIIHAYTRSKRLLLNSRIIYLHPNLNPLFYFTKNA